MSESEMVKMAVMMFLILAMLVPAIIGGIIETITNYKNKDCFKDEEAQAFLKHCQENITEQQEKRRK